MSVLVALVVVALLLVFVPISLLPIMVDQQEYDSVVQMRE